MADTCKSTGKKMAKSGKPTGDGKRKPMSPKAMKGKAKGKG